MPTMISYARLVCSSADNIVITGYQPYQPPPPIPTHDSALQHTHSPINCAHLVQAIRSHTALGLSDGSYMPQCFPGKASAAWLLSNLSLSVDYMFYGVVSVGSPLHQVNAYRAELQGLHMLLVALEFFCQQHNIQLGGITIGCDNKGVLQQAQRFNEYVPCSMPHVDLVHAINNL